MAPHTSQWLRDKKAILPRLLDQLNAALSEEWLSYYQYWTCSRLAEGEDLGELRLALEQAADEERSHASLLAERIIALGGIPPLTPQEWYRYARCTYDTPTSFAPDYLIRITMIGEECAQRRYAAIVDMTADGRDPETHALALYLQAEEAAHVARLRELLRDVRHSHTAAAPVAHAS